MANNKAFTYKFVNEGPNLLLELTNATKEVTKCVEILTVFLKNEDAASFGPSQVHIRFEAVEHIMPAEKSIMPHSIWINGKEVEASGDHLHRLQNIEGKPNPYVLDISWQNSAGKTRFQRIPVGN